MSRASAGARGAPLALRVVEALATAMALVAGVAVAALALLIAYDIVARGLFRHSVQGADELGGYTLALVGSLGLSHTLLRRGHPRIDVAFGLFPARMRAVLHVLALASITAFAVFMTVHAWGELAQALRLNAVTNTPLQTPLWVPQGLWAFGTAFFALTASALTVHAALLLGSDPVRVSALYGPVTVEEEVAEYTHDAPAGATEGTRA
jgi:TRAP-type C4-dicarboxylate transport system permease small subunit